MWPSELHPQRPLYFIFRHFLISISVALVNGKLQLWSSAAPTALSTILSFFPSLSHLFSLHVKWREKEKDKLKCFYWYIQATQATLLWLNECWCLLTVCLCLSFSFFLAFCVSVSLSHSLDSLSFSLSFVIYVAWTKYLHFNNTSEAYNVSLLVNVDNAFIVAYSYSILLQWEKQENNLFILLQVTLAFLYVVAYHWCSLFLFLFLSFSLSPGTSFIQV